MVAGDGIEPSLPAYETGLEPLQLSRKNLLVIQLSKTLAQGEGLEPSPTGLESVMLPLHQPCAFEIQAHSSR